MAPSPEERARLVDTLHDMTGNPREACEEILEHYSWDIVTAAAAIFEGDQDDHPSSSAPAPSPYTGPRTLGGAPAPPELAGPPLSSRAAGPSSSQGPAPRRGLATLRDYEGGDEHEGHGHGGGDDDPSDQDYFAGGEKSGLAVQNPGGPKKSDRNRRGGPVTADDLMRMAERGAPRPGGDDDEAPPPRSHFTGRGHTLGGDDTPSQVVEPSQQQEPARLERVRRELHLWQDGFSIDDGELYRYDNPENQRVLELIHTGRAPLDLLNVQPHQEVDLMLHNHADQDYVKPKQKYKPFAGQGQRLGSPTPSAMSGASRPSSTAESSASAAVASSAAGPPQVHIDSAQPTLMLQIRLGDGTRLQSRFNTTHTIGDVYQFVDAALTADQRRPYVLMTTFPSKDLDDRAQVLGDMAEFKRGGVVVQKWK